MKNYIVHCLFQVPVKAEDKEEAEKVALDSLDPELMWVSDSEFKVEELGNEQDAFEALQWIEEMCNG